MSGWSFSPDNPFYTKRFAYFVGRRCRQASIADVAKELALDWHTVKALEMQYIEAQLARAGTPGPRVIGIDEIAIRGGHSYRIIVVSDLLRGRPIWLGGKDRWEDKPGAFYASLGAKKSAHLRLCRHGHVEAISAGDTGACAKIRDFIRQVPRHAPSRQGTEYGPQERVRVAFWRRTSTTSRARNTPCCRAERISRSIAKKALKLAANKRLNTAYMLKESFGQLWSYEREGWARRFFENWRASLKWQRLKPYQDVFRVSTGIGMGLPPAAGPRQVSLGFVEGLDEQDPRDPAAHLQSAQRRYFRLKVLACMLAGTVASATTYQSLRASCCAGAPVAIPLNQNATRPTSLWTCGQTQVRCPHAHSRNSSRRQQIQN